MAKKNKNVNILAEEKLKNLYQLQLINTKLDEIKKLQGELPLEVQSLENDVIKLESRITKLEDEKKDLEAAVTKYQSDILESESLIEKYTRQQDDVKNNREFEALTRETELQNLDIQLAKKRIRETQVKLEKKDETLKASEIRKEQKKADWKTKQEELEKIIEKTEKDETKFQNKEKRARKKIDADLLVAYDRTRHAYSNGLAVATVERDSCGGCFSQVPPQVQLDMSQRKRIISCEHCGRILVEASILETTVNEPVGESIGEES